jgi:hypothetical protein
MYFSKLIPIKFMTMLCCCGAVVLTNVYGQFTSTKTDEGIEVSENGKKVLFYQNKPKSLNGKYERAGYVHPLYDLNGKVLTDDFPEDHPYHHGIFWAWHQIVLNDKNIAEGWTYENIFWEPKSVKVTKHQKNITLQSEMIWKSVLQKNVPTDIIKENTRITVHKSTGQYRAIDFDIHLSALVDNLKLGGSDDVKGYGGFCFRLKLPSDISFVSNDTTITPTETAVIAGPWMDITGTFDSASLSKSGVAAFCKQPAKNNQQPWILRKVTSMQNIPYPGRTPVPLSRKGWRLQYRLIIHNDSMSSNKLEKLYEEYIHNP